MPILSEALQDVPGVELAYIFGSWAARYRGEVGPIPGDVDVLVVGSADRDVLDELARGAEVRLGRPVNIRRVRPEVWADSVDPFLIEVRSRPLVSLLRAEPAAA